MRFNVPLLESQKTHDRLETPYLSSYSRQKFETEGTLTQIEGPSGTWFFAYASANRLLEATVPQDLKDLALWVADGNFARSSSSWRRDPHSPDEYLEWVGLPNGTWGVANGLLRQVYGLTLLNGGHPERSDENSRLDAECDEIWTSFSDNWKRSRQAWKRAEKKNGGLQKAQQEKEEAVAWELSEAKNSAKVHLKHLIELLETQIEHVDNNTVTVDNVRTIFNATNELTSRHARLKAALKAAGFTLTG